MSLGVFDLDPSLLRSPGLGDIYGTGEPDYGLKRRRDRSNSIDQEAPSKRLPTLADKISAYVGLLFMTLGFLLAGGASFLLCGSSGFTATLGGCTLGAKEFMVTALALFALGYLLFENELINKENQTKIYSESNYEFSIIIN